MLKTVLGEKLRVLSPRGLGVLNTADLLRLGLRAMVLGDSIAVREKRGHLSN